VVDCFVQRFVHCSNYKNNNFISHGDIVERVKWCQTSICSHTDIHIQDAHMDTHTHSNAHTRAHTHTHAHRPNYTHSIPGNCQQGAPAKLAAGAAVPTRCAHTYSRAHTNTHTHTQTHTHIHTHVKHTHTYTHTYTHTQTRTNTHKHILLQEIVSEESLLSWPQTQQDQLNAPTLTSNPQGQAPPPALSFSLPKTGHEFSNLESSQLGCYTNRTLKEHCSSAGPLPKFQPATLMLPASSSTRSAPVYEMRVGSEGTDAEWKNREGNQRESGTLSTMSNRCGGGVVGGGRCGCVGVGVGVGLGVWGGMGVRVGFWSWGCGEVWEGMGVCAWPWVWV